MIYLVEITAAINSAGTTSVLRFSSDGYTTYPTDSPANTYYEPRVKTPAEITRNLFSNGTTSGASRVGYGVVELANVDGGLDYMLPYGYAGQNLTIKVGNAGSAYSTFTTILSGTMEQVEFTFQTVTVLARDKLFVLDSPLQKIEFNGSNSLSDTSTTSNAIGIGSKTFTLVTGTSFSVGSVVMAYQTTTPANYMIGTVTSYTTATKVLVINSLYTGGSGTITAWTINQTLTGVEGNADSVGTKKPIVYGTVYNVTVPCVNTSKLVFQVSSELINDVPAVYDKGSSLTKGSDYTSVAEMMATAPAAGNYRVVKTASGSFIRLGSSPAGLITCDAVQGSTVANRTAAQLIKQIAIKGGVLLADINATDITDLDAANSAVVGLFVNSNASSIEYISQVADSIGAWFGYDATGQFRMGRFTVASGVPDISITDDNIITIEATRPTDTDRGIPSYKVILAYYKNYTVQSNDIATGVTQDRRNFLQRDFAKVTAEDSTVKNQFSTAVEINRNTLMIDATAAQTEATRILNLYKTQRRMYQIQLALDVSEHLPELNDVANLTLDRFGLDSGTLFRIIGISSSYAKNRATLTLWG